MPQREPGLQSAYESVSIMSDLDTVRDEIAAEFAKTGNATVALVDLNMTLQDWRKVARSAARQLGRPVETVANETRA